LFKFKGEKPFDEEINFYLIHGIKQFQRENDLTVDGKWNKTTEGLAKKLTENLQSNLHYIGIYIGEEEEIDGILDYYTINV
jgi:hypothetical protein